MDLILTVSTIFATFLIILLSSLLYFRILKKESPSHQSLTDKETVIVFVDAPDPDNPAAVAAITKHILPTVRAKKPHLHVVLTGRLVDLRTRKATKCLSLNELIRQPEETSVDSHGRRVLEDSAVRFENYLVKCNISPSIFTIYDGGVAPSAPLSDRFHEWDFLFDRRDLCTGDSGDAGEILSYGEYQTLTHRYNDLSEEERERQLLRLLRRFHFKPLLDLSQLMRQSCGDVIIFLGGPATALTRLFTGSGQDLRDRVRGVYGMFGALEPGKGTLLANQFNVACDVEAACEFLIEDIFPNADKYLVATETCKNSELVVSANDLSRKDVGEYFVKLQSLWEESHGGRPQPMFDVIPVMAYLVKYKSCFQWTPRRAILKEWKRKDGQEEQIFSYIEPRESEELEGRGRLYVSKREVRALGKDDLLDFLKEAWS